MENKAGEDVKYMGIAHIVYFEVIFSQMHGSDWKL